MLVTKNLNLMTKLYPDKKQQDFMIRWEIPKQNLSYKKRQQASHSPPRKPQSSCDYKQLILYKCATKSSSFTNPVPDSKCDLSCKALVPWRSPVFFTYVFLNYFNFKMTNKIQNKLRVGLCKIQSMRNFSLPQRHSWSFESTTASVYEPTRWYETSL